MVGFEGWVEQKTISFAVGGVYRSTHPTKKLQTGVCLLLYRGWKPLPQVVCRDSEIALRNSVKTALPNLQELPT